MVSDTIAEIDNNNPVIVVLEVTEDFQDCTDGTHWRAPVRVTPGLGHAMVLVGYDDIRQEFELVNSFGPDWCDGGFVHISYEDFSRAARYGYVLYLEGNNLDCDKR